jgi:hypothetical protein
LRLQSYKVKATISLTQGGSRESRGQPILS